MPDWQDELEALLSQLHVSLEADPLPPPPSTSDANISPPASAQDGHATGEAGWDPRTASEELPADGDEVSAVRSEVEATIHRVIAMARAGRLPRELRDDVVFVLEALTRPAPRGQRKSRTGPRARATELEWQLASAAAVLRFCRIVLRLTNELTRDAEC
jgi:hypothetical protein